jgi:hypothetical protein
VKRQTLLTAAFLFLAIVCTAGAAWTTYWSFRFGLAPRPPLPPLQTVARFTIVTLGVFLLLFRRDSIERLTLLCTVVAAGSSALFGLGFRSTTLDIVRLIFHFFAYALGIVVSVRWLSRLWRGPSTEGGT